MALILFVVAATGSRGWAYLSNFRADAAGHGSRWVLAQAIEEESRRWAAGGESLEIAVLREPAPYCLPPLRFGALRVILYDSVQQFLSTAAEGSALLLEPVDRPVNSAAGGRFSAFGSVEWSAPVTPISWANKPFQVIWKENRRANEVLPP